MKRILIVFTGGTIGSKLDGASIDVQKGGSYSLLEAYARQTDARADVALDTIQPLNLLSENITPRDWIELAAALRETDWSRYAGIVVTHGSDTLAYTSCLAGYLFADIPIPLVLTASNYPIQDPRSNGLRNLSAAIDFVAEEGLPGVFAVYENGLGGMQIYLGTRLMQCEPFTDQFRAPYDLAYGTMENRRFVWRGDARNPEPGSLAPKPPLHDWTAGRPALETGVVYIRPYPGLDYSHYRLDGGRVKAVLHDLHHSGTACSVDDGPYSLPAFISRCREQGIDVYLCPVKDAADALYASSHALVEAGATILDGMSVEAALTKLMLVYGQAGTGVSRPRAAMKASVYYERLAAL